ncbi:MAG TPA: hypothetical protein VJQ84_05995 [Solirubrobacterales bacterium]|nr:hypothetical protein [Solirubrobacterales bacterium]
MFSTLRDRFGIPGVISVIALVFAMFGGAYAASNSSNAGKATASAKAKKGPRGPKGPKGDTGAAGPQGPAGQAGAAGAKGDPGQAGSAGANGKSVTAEEFEGNEGPCEEGGVEFTSASPEPAYACNGAEGPEGPKGDPWTVGGTLPSGATETGAWTLKGGGGPVSQVPLSFTVPLEQGIPASNVHYEFQGFQGEPGSDCPGNLTEPAAKPGHLCVYAGLESEELLNIEILTLEGLATKGASTAGAILTGLPENAAVRYKGSWAVTAP